MFDHCSTSSFLKAEDQDKFKWENNYILSYSFSGSFLFYCLKLHQEKEKKGAKGK